MTLSSETRYTERTSNTAEVVFLKFFVAIDRLTFALTRGRVPLLDVAAVGCSARLGRVASRHEPPPNGSCWPKADLEPKGFEHGLHFGKPLPTRLRISRKTNRAFL